MSKVTTNALYIALYTIVNLFTLLNYNGLYWDDWVIYNQDAQTMAVLFDMIQHNIKGDLYLILSKLFNHIYAFRIFIFVSYLFIGYFIYVVLASTKLIGENESKFIALLSVIIPINIAKIYISVAPFVFPMLLFYLAFFLLARNYPIQTKSLKIIILTIFFFSFSTNSILVFYASVLLYLYYMDNGLELRLNFKTILNFVKSRWEFILLPIFYFIYKSMFLVPYGIYKNYNGIKFSFDVIAGNFLKNIENMIGGVALSLFDNLYITIFALVVSGLIALSFNCNLKIGKRNSLVFLALSAVLFILALFPYAAVNKVPVLTGPDSRFALLLGPSLSMLFVSIVSMISMLFLRYKQKAFLFLASFLTILIGSKSMSQQYDVMLDNFYNVAVVESFRDNKEIRENTTFVGHYHKYMNYYEWNGMLKKAFGDTKRLMIHPLMIKDLEGGADSPLQGSRTHKQYNFYEWDGNTDYKIVFVDKHMNMTPIIQAKLMYYYLFDYDKFKSLAKKLVNVNLA
ncbi:hypothetical protein [Vibrio neptunius]|uniref:Glycosyltransferase RgtA/B/C/D-like domain-containing protein n=1 Tax=Vibrio neptunius TaxID=170651 RepID=A0ABS3A347_9VIBR|nr:hypothetical protein [Vibrio neptunius]MBN3493420.1 hypothetical protein [Vibrio neptunius]MBN3515886.1 hypothetical protein [Vibrio neptunius]MBN3550089.1 hypothetical protein [Vibrio neptunius]MBN3578191.1 hypothetical protein [Vibrio neptunius]MCH9871855.1 hypothetical protein [Vibrio neptunius]